MSHLDPNITVGCTVLVLALACMSGLVIWSIKLVNRVADRKLKTARDIMRDLDNGR